MIASLEEEEDTELEDLGINSPKIKSNQNLDFINTSLCSTNHMAEEFQCWEFLGNHLGIRHEQGDGGRDMC